MGRKRSTPSGGSIILVSLNGRRKRVERKEKELEKAHFCR
jgi:hypothetical protein